MGNIIKMPSKLANLIAAGEVVERPSNVVKELVENSIDAKASSIKIYLREGGLEEIKIIDDGLGMDSDDVDMAFMPHATSKIKNEYDLLRISTLGFRGEAIASISAVSEMTITSSTDGINGYYATYKGGVRVKGEATHSNKGTTILVRGLFYNTPARLKYMKSAKSELSSILYFVDRIAMAHPEMKFMVYHDEKLVFQTTGSSKYNQLIGEVYGIDAAKNVITHSYSADGYKMNLVFVKPSIYRANKLEITLICNGRFVKSYIITNAVVDGFQTYLPISKYPIGIIYLDIDPLLIDVNVHPTKTEIKISNEEDIANRLRNEIKDMLLSITYIPKREIEKKEAFVKPTIFDSDFNNTLDAKVSEDKPTYTVSYEEIPIKKEEPKIEPVIEKKKEIVVEEDNRFPYLEYVGCVFGTYLIFQNSEGMYLLDQHAAAERVNFEKYYEILGNPNQPKTDLLVPRVLEFTKSEALFISEHLDEFEAIGFTLSELSDNSFALRGIPLWAHVDELEGLVIDLIKDMTMGKKVDVANNRFHLAASIACKASIKANHQLSKEEINGLLDNLKKCKNPFTCPHGRPSLIKLSVSDIEKMFERIQK